MESFRVETDLISSRKLAFMAKVADVTLAEMLAIWLFYLSHAAEQKVKGFVGNICFKTIAYTLACDLQKIENVHKILTDHGEILNGMLVEWEKQPSKTHPKNAEYLRRHKEKKLREKENSV